MNHKIDRDTYIIPPNFIESGTFFGGMFKARNVIEAGILAFAIGVPVFSLLPLSLTARIIALCLTALPAALVALIGISGESLSSFLLIFIKYLRNRRIIGGNSAEDAVPAAEHGGKHIKKKVHKPDKAPRRSRRSGREDFTAEFDEVRSYEIRQKLRPVKKQKPAKEKKAKVKTEDKSEQKAESKQERKPREPQMVTANGEKVTHGHAYQSKANSEEWYFTAKMDGKQLKPQRMDAADLAAFQKKEMAVPQLMERYYPTKLLPKVPEKLFRMPQSIAGPEGRITVEKFNVYKEKDEQRPDYGKYKFYAQIGDTKMSAVASRQDLNAYFDRVMTPDKLVERNFGERLHLKSAYEKYQLPEVVDSKGVRVAKDRSDNKWKVSVDMGDKGKTSRHEISFDDGYSLFKTKTATREQIAAKYLNTEITGLLSAQTAKLDKTASLKM